MAETNKKTETKKHPWFVIHTYSGHESKVAAALKQRIEAIGLSDQITEILIPTRDKVVISEGKKRKVEEKLFPGYILVKMLLSDTTWPVVRGTTGVTGFVGIEGKPTSLPEKEVESIMRFMKIDVPKFEVSFNLGDTVKIIDGPFTDFLGKVDSMDGEKGKVRVLVSIFGRETPVELDFMQVTRL